MPNAIDYNPDPPRVWSRVQNYCLIDQNDNNEDNIIYIPLTKQYTTSQQAYYQLQMLQKGNVLQYKANSSNLTKAQKYSKIAKGKWVNRNTTWATQSSRGYTNPNTTSLKRTASINLAIDPITGQIIEPTTEPINCNPIFIPDYPVLPSNDGGGANIPPIPPPIVPTPGSDVFPDIIPDTPVKPIIIQDGGTLICSVVENICTGETIYQPANENVNFTTDSDVPGTIEPLYWNDALPTWYPRQRYKMTNSDNKWPTNYKGLVSAIKPSPPFLAVIADTPSYVELSWSINNCIYLSVTSFNIYVNDILFTNITNNDMFITTLRNLPSNYNSIYITSLIQTLESLPSNVVYTDGKPPETNNDNNNPDTEPVLDIVKYYNDLLKNNIIVQINTYLLIYNNNINNVNDQTYISSDLFNDLYGKLHSMIPKNNSKNSLFIKSILETYISILKVLYHAFNNKRDFFTLSNDVARYKEDSLILRTPELLKEYLNKLNEVSKKNTFMEVNIVAPFLEIANEYIIYNQLYGMPLNSIYDPDLLDYIRKTM